MRIPRRYLLWAVIFVVFFAASFVSFHVAFADEFGTIVPTCDSANGYYGGFSGACQLCDLVKLARQLINFAVAFSVIVATLMFTYAGVLYFTSGAQDNIKKAHGIFIKVFVGLVIILAAWLVVDLIMRTLMGEKLNVNSFGPWNTFQCETYPTTAALQPLNLPPVSSVTGGGSGTGVQGVTPAQEQDARRELVTNSGGHICISASGSTSCDATACTDTVTQHCTSVGGLTLATQQQLEAIAQPQHCNCTLTITGGSEGGHSENGQHNEGTAVDLRWDPTLAQYLIDHHQDFNIRQICTSDPNYHYGPACSESVQQIHVGFGG